MRIQFISYDGEEKYQTKETIICNIFNNAKSFDEFDINIISLQNKLIWRNEKNLNTCVDCSNDLISLNTQLYNSEKSSIIVLLPQNYYFSYFKNSQGGYYNNEQLKDCINCWAQSVLKNSLFKCFFAGSGIKYDNSTTVINNVSIESTFSFIDGYEAVTRSTGKQITSIRINERIYLTGLNFKSEGFDLDSFLKEIGLVENKVEIPDWLVNYKFFNDNELLDNLKNEEERLRLVNTKINDIKDQLDENMSYKVALISSGDELVSIVFDTRLRIYWNAQNVLSENGVQQC